MDNLPEINANTPLAFPSSIRTGEELPFVRDIDDSPKMPVDKIAPTPIYKNNFDREVLERFEWLNDNIFPSKLDARDFLANELFLPVAVNNLSNSFIVLNHNKEMRSILMLLSSLGYKMKNTSVKNPKYLRIKGKKIIFRSDWPFSHICREVSIENLSKKLQSLQK